MSRKDLIIPKGFSIFDSLCFCDHGLEEAVCTCGGVAKLTIGLELFSQRPQANSWAVMSGFPLCFLSTLEFHICAEWVWVVGC